MGICKALKGDIISRITPPAQGGHAHKSHLALCASPVIRTVKIWWVHELASSSQLSAHLYIYTEPFYTETRLKHREQDSRWRPPKGPALLLQYGHICIACHASKVTLTWTDTEMLLLVFVFNVALHSRCSTWKQKPTLSQYFLPRSDILKHPGC